MKRTVVVSVIVLSLIVSLLCWAGIGVYSSGSAVRDLKTELETIFGSEYVGKDVENGTENMVFVVEPKTWFLTNWNLRNALSMDYEYECKVVFTTYIDGSVKSIRTITYQAVDPMGAENSQVRAHLELDSQEEKTENIE